MSNMMGSNTATSYHPFQSDHGITWSSFVCCLVVPIILLLLKHTGPLDRPVLPLGSPKLWARYHWPIVGSALRFYGSRRDMVVAGTRATSGGTFSFFVGRKHIVNLGGLEGRRTFFENKDFSVSQGFVELLTGLVSSNDARDDYGAAYFVKCVAALSRAEKLAERLPVLTGDIREFCRELQSQPPIPSNPQWRVMDVTDSVYFVLYRLVQRSVGATEIAEDAKLMRYTLRTFETFEQSSSLAHIMFPWLITPKYVTRLLAGAKLYMVVKKLLANRKASSSCRDDALQYIYDQDSDDDKVVRFIFSALSSSVTMTGASATWLPAFLSNSPAWQTKCREEVDTVISKRRSDKSQSPNDILATLTLQEWETEFPVIYSCLQETLRITSTGTFFRKNASGRDVPIGDSGSVVANNSYAAYLPDNVHMDPQNYPSPLNFDPGRFSDAESAGGQDPHVFLGWGSGRHLCAGMRLAKLEINLILVHMLANFEWELSDQDGSSKVGAELTVDRNLLRPEKSRTPIFVRYKPRDFCLNSRDCPE